MPSSLPPSVVRIVVDVIVVGVAVVVVVDDVVVVCVIAVIGVVLICYAVDRVVDSDACVVVGGVAQPRHRQQQTQHQ